MFLVTVYILIPYALGFVSLVLTRSYAVLFTILAVNIGLAIAAFFWATTGGGLIVLIVAPTIIGFTAGAVAGSVTAGILIATKWPRLDKRSIAVISLGLLALPGLQFARVADNHRQWKAAYAALPDASELPDIQACNFLRDTGPLLDGVVTTGDDPQRSPIAPLTDTALRYPAAFRDLIAVRRFSPEKPHERINFRMYLDGGRPAPPEDNWTADGKPVPLNARKPSIDFYVFARAPMEQHGPRIVNVTLGDSKAGSSMPALELAPSNVEGLMEVRHPKLSEKGVYDRIFVSDASLSEVLQCKGTCKFNFDFEGVPVGGKFYYEDLPEWPKIRRYVRDFAECSLRAAADPAS